MSDKKYPLKNDVDSSEEKNYQYGFNHFFNVGHAQKYGVNAAIVLNHLIYWSKDNYANNRNIYDGYVWTYNSITALQEILPYFSEKQIRYCLTKLIKYGVIKTGNYNKSSYDKTNWYAIIDKRIIQRFVNNNNLKQHLFCGKVYLHKNDYPKIKEYMKEL